MVYNGKEPHNSPLRFHVFGKTLLLSSAATSAGKRKKVNFYLNTFQRFVNLWYVWETHYCERDRAESLIRHAYALPRHSLRSLCNETASIKRFVVPAVGFAASFWGVSFSGGNRSSTGDRASGTTSKSCEAPCKAQPPRNSRQIARQKEVEHQKLSFG